MTKFVVTGLCFTVLFYLNLSAEQIEVDGTVPVHGLSHFVYIIRKIAYTRCNNGEKPRAYSWKRSCVLLDHIFQSDCINTITY